MSKYLFAGPIISSTKPCVRHRSSDSPIESGSSSMEPCSPKTRTCCHTSTTQRSSSTNSNSTNTISQSSNKNKQSRKTSHTSGMYMLIRLFQFSAISNSQLALFNTA